MKKIIQRFTKFSPYMKRPILWPELWRRAIYSMRLKAGRIDLQKIQEETQEASEWCKSVSISSEDALKQLGAAVEPLHEYTTRHRDELANAEQRANQCPIQMGGGGNSALIYALCEFLQTTTAVETGVAYGWSSLAILLSLSKRSGSRLYSIDLPYFELRNDQWVGVVVPEKFQPIWTLLRMADREGVPRILRTVDTVDFVHYDSDKSYEGRIWAYRKLWKALKPGGVILSDDINDNFGFRDFCREIDYPPTVISFEDKYQGLLRK